ncbi:MAG: small ribosomal subunit Rsm22 family protein [Rhizobiaceae bacterium]
MELPAALRAAVDDMLSGEPLASLQQAASRLSARYRSETLDGKMHLDAKLAIKAYLAARLPATYAAVRTSFEATSERLPEFSPSSLLDVGAGPGTSFWAATDCWPTIVHATMIEASVPAREAGIRLAQEHAVAGRWISADATSPLSGVVAADLVTLAYVLDELPANALGPLVARLWELTSQCLIVIEPGTPAGWKRILAVRETLIAAGAHIVAPCPHQNSCPISEPDWCHFSRRVARSRIHRLAKSGDVPWEDEKFIYVAASRSPAPATGPRVIAPPRTGSGQVRLKLCMTNGEVDERLFTKRNGDAFREARRADWGDTLSGAE